VCGELLILPEKVLQRRLEKLSLNATVPFMLIAAGYHRIQSQALRHITGDNITVAYFRPQLPPKL